MRDIFLKSVNEVWDLLSKFRWRTTLFTRALLSRLSSTPDCLQMLVPEAADVAGAGDGALFAAGGRSPSGAGPWPRPVPGGKSGRGNGAGSGGRSPVPALPRQPVTCSGRGRPGRAQPSRPAGGPVLSRRRHGGSAVVAADGGGSWRWGGAVVAPAELANGTGALAGRWRCPLRRRGRWVPRGGGAGVPRARRRGLGGRRWGRRWGGRRRSRLFLKACSLSRVRGAGRAGRAPEKETPQPAQRPGLGGGLPPRRRFGGGCSQQRRLLPAAPPGTAPRDQLRPPWLVEHTEPLSLTLGANLALLQPETWFRCCFKIFIFSRCWQVFFV